MADDGSVHAAFDMLLEEMARDVSVVKSASHSAIDADDFDEATRLAARAKAMDGFKVKLAALRDEWNGLHGPSAGGAVPSGPPRATRAPHGSRIHVDEFRVPLLKALDERGGGAPKADVLKRVEEMLRGRLGPIEYTPIPSNPRRMRWLVRAEWARFRLTEEGLMKKGSPRGIWEISDAGREYLAKNGG